jgi:UDP-N-acetylglucosamine:LPS N-acetylglucosamine transferase
MYTDAYFVACEEIKNCLVKKGINNEHIYISGIPVRQEFKTYNFSPVRQSYKNILIMGGGIGLIPKCDEILFRLNQMSNIIVTVITGKNNKLYRSLKNKYPNIRIFGYSDNISQLMNSADILISKPGGITLFEAINSELPIFIIKPTLAHEIINADYVEQKGIGRVVWHNNSNTYDELAALLYDDNQLNVMKNQMRRIKKQTQKINLCQIIKDWSIE